MTNRIKESTRVRRQEDRFIGTVYCLIDVVKEMGLFQRMPSQLARHVSEQNKKKLFIQPNVARWYINEEGVKELIKGVLHSKLAKHLRADENNLILTP